MSVKSRRLSQTAKSHFAVCQQPLAKRCTAKQVPKHSKSERLRPWRRISATIHHLNIKEVDKRKTCLVLHPFFWFWPNALLRFKSLHFASCGGLAPFNPHPTKHKQHCKIRHSVVSMRHIFTGKSFGRSFWRKFVISCLSLCVSAASKSVAILFWLQKQQN